MPEIAKIILNNNTMNRAIRSTSVEYLKKQMITGKWKNNYDAIVLASDGTLLDGQHRLEACKQANTYFICDVRVMADKSHFPEINTGTSRTPGDVLKINGHNNYNTLSLALTLLYNYENTTLMNRQKISREELLGCAKKHPDIMEISGPIAQRAYSSVGISKGTGVFLHYSFYNIDPVLANDMFEKIITGANLESGDPVLALIRLLLNNKNSSKRYHRYVLIALVIKTWNALRKGRSLSRIHYEPSTEPFPSIL